MASEATPPPAETQQPQEWYFQAQRVVPVEAWYGLGLSAAFAALGLWLAGEREWSGFVGMYAPVFLLLALFHRPPARGRNAGPATAPVF